MMPLLIVGDYFLGAHILRYALASQIGFSCMSLAHIFWQLILVPHLYFQLSCTSLNGDSFWWSCALSFLGPPPPTTGPVSPNFKNHLSELDETFLVISPLILWSLTKITARRIWRNQWNMIKQPDKPRQGNIQRPMAVGQTWARPWGLADGRDFWKEWKEHEGVMAPGRESVPWELPCGKSLGTEVGWPASGAGGDEPPGDWAWAAPGRKPHPHTCFPSSAGGDSVVTLPLLGKI